jgi:hypothetical protein
MILIFINRIELSFFKFYVPIIFNIDPRKIKIKATKREKKKSSGIQ